MCPQNDKNGDHMSAISGKTMVRLIFLVAIACLFGMQQMMLAEAGKKTAKQNAYKAITVSTTQIPARIGFGPEVLPDTLSPINLFNCAPTLYLADGGGYTTGTNAFGDLEKVQKYENTDSLTVSEILIRFGVKTVAASPGNVTGVIYDEGPDGAPGNRLRFSKVAMTEADTSGFLTSFRFDPAVVITGNFFVGIEMSTVPGDTIGIVATSQQCHVPSNSWERWSDGRWTTLADSISWGLEIDFYVFPIVERIPTAIYQEAAPDIEVFTLLQNYPNPFNPSTTISFSLEKPGKIDLLIYNQSGELVTTLLQERMTGGRHEVVWGGRDQNGREVSAGVYFYQLILDKQLQRARKMVLVR